MGEHTSKKIFNGKNLMLEHIRNFNLEISTDKQDWAKNLFSG